MRDIWNTYGWKTIPLAFIIILFLPVVIIMLFLPSQTIEETTEVIYGSLSPESQRKAINYLRKLQEEENQ